MRRAMQAVDSTGTLTPAHLFVGASEVAGPVADALRDRSAGAPGLREVLGLPAPNSGAHAGHVVAPGAGQAEASACVWARQRGESASPEHLIVVLVDQGDNGVRDALARAGMVPAELRQVALRTLGAPSDLAPIPLVPLQHWPAGTGSNPSLGLSEMPAGAWTQLQARQDRLPLAHLHRQSDWYAIMSNEDRAVQRLADQLHLDEDRTYSLLHHHHDAVTRRAHDVAPGIVGLPRDPAEPPIARIVTGPMPWHFRHPVLAGWGCWFGNRRVDARAAWLRLTVQR